jgi:ribosomal protein S18 acetylase RimI-like enzyme
MEDAALGVHVENPHGAMRLYENLGFVVQDEGATYEKPFGTTDSPAIGR